MLLIPGFTYIDLGLDGGPYDERAHPKVCWHMTEGTSIAGAEAAFAPYPPHAIYEPRTRGRRQYISADLHSYALKGAESDDEYVIQIEVVGFSAAAPSWPDEYYRNIGVDVVRPLRELLGIPDAHLRFYSDREGIVLASKNSPIRLSDAAFRTFSGHLGHQHVPAPDAHWDPGGFRFNEAISASYPPVEETDMPGIAYPFTLTPTRPPGAPEKVVEVVIPMVWQGGVTGSSEVYVAISNGNAPMKIAVAEWQMETDHGQDVFPMLPAGTVIAARETSGGKLAPPGTYSLILDYDSPVGGSVMIEAR